jgi:hypothetical protein
MSDETPDTSEFSERLAEMTRQLNQAKIQFGLLGAACGAAAGALIAYKVAYSRAEMKYNKIADEEIAEMREHYQAKARALDAQAQKGDLESIVAERGYSSTNEGPPMAVPPPETAITEEEDDSSVDEDNIPSPDVEDESPVRSTFHPTEEDRQEAERRRKALTAKVEDTWDYHEELKRRSPDIPYVIHIDESDEMEGYQKVTLTYYEVDDVLCNERDEIVDPDYERDRLIGERNLNLFGHGSNQADVVYIRNDQLEIVFEVCKSPNSFAEEVHGFRHESWDRGNLERMRARERDDPEE